MKNTLSHPSFGLVTANPSEYLVHQRFGKTRFLGRGSSVTLLPCIDRYWLIPSCVQSISFCADQITSENQGIEISGFALWSVMEPQKIVEVVDFTDSEEAMKTIGSHLQGLVESAIRHQIANLSLEDALRQRGTIIKMLKDEILDVADAWGLEMTTIEITNVKIMSKQLFENLQASYRNRMRLEASKSDLQTHEIISQDKAAVREKEAIRDMEHRKAQAMREDELKRDDITREFLRNQFVVEQEVLMEQAHYQSQVAIQHAKEKGQVEITKSVCAVIEMEKEIAQARFITEQKAKENALELSRMDNAIQKGKIEADNSRSLPHLIADGLPKMLENTSIGEVNLGDPTLIRSLEALVKNCQNQNKDHDQPMNKS